MINAGDGKARILIIDDEAEVRNLLRGMLSDSYHCTAAGSAEEALALLRAEKFDLLISDIKLGGMSGLEMIPRVGAIAPDTVMVVVSGQQTIESAIEALRVGAFDYITKPFDLRHVESAVRRALDYHSSQEAKRRHESQLEELVRQRTDELNRLSYYDVLTDLPNRVLFEDRLAQALALAQHDRQSLGMMFLSLDRFRKVTDTLGHAQGYLLLQQIAARLAGCVPEGATVARFEGDEFALLARPDGAGYPVELISRINEAMRLPFALGGHELFVTASIGISLYPEDGEDAPTLLKNAGAALHRAKEQGGNNYQFYTADMNARALKRLTLENDLRRALERSEFEVYYQPLLDISTTEVVGAEALVRWQHPGLGFLPPAEFIPLAEETGLIVPLGEWVLREACAQCSAWHADGLGPLAVAVNLSAHQFQQRGLSEVVIQALRETGLSPQSLELELTESSIMKNAESAVKTLGELKEMGIKIAVDDFGTGYSSLGYLKSLPIDKLKIDQTFVREVTTDPNDAALVMAIISLAHNFRLKVLAEGVETEEQLRFLHLLRCDEWQGYLCSPPLPAAAFEQLLMSRRAAPAEV